MKFKKPPEEILKDLGIYEPEEIDLELVAFSLNAEVSCIPLASVEGSIIGTDSKAIIKINSNAALEKQRFSLGHELGHWVNDKGKNLSFDCSSRDMQQFHIQKNNFKQHKEVRANKFSAELIMPNYLFYTYLSSQPISFTTIKALAELFRSSITSTSIRLIELTECPCMIVCWDDKGNKKWFSRSSTLPDEIWPLETLANFREVLKAHDDVIEVDGDTWLQGDQSFNFNIFQSIFFNGYNFISLLWWKDEDQLESYNQLRY